MRKSSDIDYILAAFQEMGRLGIEGAIVGEKLKEELMNDKETLKIGEGWVELYDSLLESVDEAGGAIDYFRFNKLKNMSVFELFNKIATNRIRFICLDKRKEE